MDALPAPHKKLYELFNEYCDTYESKRRWNPFHDIPWDKLDTSRLGPDDALCVETFFGVEAFVPDYTTAFLKTVRFPSELNWFALTWGGEESKHALTFREYLLRAKLRSDEEVRVFEQAIYDKVWNADFGTQRQLSCFVAIQESVTHMIYAVQLERAQRIGDPVLESIYSLIGRDEAAHRGFFRKLLKIQLEEDREGTLEDLAHVAFHFRMPGGEQIPDYARRVAVAGVGLEPGHFLQHGVFPLLKALGTDRRELVGAYGRAKTRAKQAARDAEPSGSASA